MEKDILFVTNSQKVLAFILRYPHKDFTGREIEEAVKLKQIGDKLCLKRACAYRFCL